MLDIDDRPLLFLRFGLQRKKDLLVDAKRSYDGIVIPANILLYQYKSTPAFIYRCQKPFFIDPMSYLFGQPYEEFKLRVKKGAIFKPSFHRLMEGHGISSEDYLSYSSTSLLSLLMRSQDKLSTFVDSALEFQRDKVWTVIQEIQDLLPDNEKQSVNEEIYRPRFLIPPYFLYIDDTDDKNTNPTKLNFKILEYCWQKRDEWRDLFPMIFISKECLCKEGELLKNIISKIHKFEFPGCCLWIDDCDEKHVSKEQIEGLIYLIKELSANGKQLVMLYGGFFSMLLYHYGLTCVCHGLSYGESRSINAFSQKGSGPAPIRYYISELHTFLVLENALRILRKREDLLCTCPACQRIMGGNPENVTKYADEEAFAEIHFLYNRFDERQMISEYNIEKTIKYLDNIYKINNDIKEITKQYKIGEKFEERPIIEPEYIMTWKTAIEKSHSSGK